MRSITEENKLGLEAASLGLVPGYDGSMGDKTLDTDIKKKRKATNKIRNKINNKGIIRLLEVTTRGFKDGVLQHNMPCPVCLKQPAKYISQEGMHYFGPCEACEALGYTLENKKNKKGWFR